MITVSIDYRLEQIRSFTVEGHADAHAHGEYDMVCAAVTAVTVGTVNAIEALTETMPDVSYQEDGGYLQYKVPANASEKQMQKIQLITQTMIISLETIADQFAKHIKIIHHK